MKKLLAILGVLGMIALVSSTLAQQPVSVGDSIRGKSFSEIASIKSDAILRENVTGTYNDPTTGVRVEIQSIEKIEGGIEILARAWRGADQLGFGADGTVEIERFRFYNPRILVSDPIGIYVRMGEDGEQRFREDPRAAIREELAEQIAIHAKNGYNIISGKVGRTTTTFYPDADPESTSVDGYVALASSATWSTVRDGPTGAVADDSGVDPTARTDHDGSFFGIYRTFLLFDTSAIDDAETIDTATVVLYVTAKTNGDNDGNDYIAVVTSTPASNTALATADYDQCGTTEQSDQLDITNISTSAANTWTLNPTGEGNVSKTGITKFCIREGHDIQNDPIAVSTINRISIASADTLGTTQDPALTVVSSSASAVKNNSRTVIIIQ